MRKYAMVRARNIRIYEHAVLEFPSDEEALAAAKDAHLKDGVVGYDGKQHMLVENEEFTPPPLNDVAWSIQRIVGPKEREDVTAGFDSVLSGYVFTTDVFELCDEISSLDPSWPPDMRRIRSAMHRLKQTMHTMNEQVAREEQGA